MKIQGSSRNHSIPSRDHSGPKYNTYYQARYSALEPLFSITGIPVENTSMVIKQQQVLPPGLNWNGY